ncbi:hypothetical protein HPC49_16715 [Pyxidicoccus fallax]|uniref:Uncharacterized protein n=1 Tax=Pyxidicoccus fallax TaxID=394095 RepID=A0A848LJC7_9BACT|nr:hypothetical protein [Pyxidicoccus fallax]NMO17820.1 hypothetical protein [Pyxidicoccus fallax]NPC79860.1 hypothetical protein [Pyxidicoccus fallax]
MRERSWFFHVVMMMVLCLGPGRAAAELPLLSLPSMGTVGLQTDVLAGSSSAGLGTYIPFPCTREADGLVLEARQGFRNAAFNAEAAYHLRFSPTHSDVLSDSLNVAMQLGLHLHTATRRSDEAGLGPALGFSLSRVLTDVPWKGYVEGFAGVQGSTVMSPSSARLDVPVRASLGLQGRVGRVHLMLVTRGGYDDFRRDFGGRPTVDATLAVGLWHFENLLDRVRR